MSEARRSRASSLLFPFASIVWLVATSVLYLALENDAGQLPPRVYDAVGFVPDAAIHAPWRFLLAPISILFNHDPVQFAFVTASFALVVPYFEAREGWRRAAFVFLAGTLASVVAVTLLVFAPFHALLPANEALAKTVSRAYFGGSVGTFAVLGALVARLVHPARWLILAAALGWLAWELAFYYRFTEFNSIYHLAAIPLGAIAVRLDVYRRLSAREEPRVGSSHER